jgi:hypothetical protein
LITDSCAADRVALDGNEAIAAKTDNEPMRRLKDSAEYRIVPRDSGHSISVLVSNQLGCRLPLWYAAALGLTMLEIDWLW